jgi:hypothetical protein
MDQPTAVSTVARRADCLVAGLNLQEDLEVRGKLIPPQ